MSLALHETLELHEMAAFKSLCLTKAKTMQILVSDEALKDLMQEEVRQSSRQLEDLSGLLTRAIQ